LAVGAEEDGRPKDALKSSSEAPVLRTALLHAEGVQHLCSAAKGNARCLLTNRKCRQKDRDEPVVTPRQAVARVPRDLENELAIVSFVKQAARSRPLHRKTAKDKWPRRETEVLPRGFPSELNASQGLDLAHSVP
jgi:hypothetical protein